MRRKVVISMLAAVAALASLWLLVPQGGVGPFGLSMGMKPEEFSGKLQKGDSPGFYFTTEVPIPYNAFQTYFLFFSPKSGLCKIVAEGKPLNTSADGDTLKSAFKNMEERLEKQYGKKYRGILDTELLNSKDDFPDFMTKLLDKYTLGTFWTKKDNPDLKNNLSIVWLSANALSTNIGYLLLHYEFENFDQCQEENKAVEDKAL